MKHPKFAAHLVSALTVAAAMTGGVAAAKTVTLGFTGPLSGGAAQYGQNALSGIQMAIDEIKANGGYEICGETYEVTVQALDDKYSPSEAAINAKRLVQQHRVPVVFTPQTGGTFAMQAFNQRDGFIIAAYTSVPEIVERGNKLTVRIPPSYEDYVEPFTVYLQERFGTKLGVANGTHTYAKLWTEAFTPVWEEQGGEVVIANPMDYNRDTDFYSGVSRVLAAKPDVLLIGGASEPAGLVAQQARNLGFQGGFAVMDQAKLDEMARVVGLEPLEGAIGVMPLIYNEAPAAQRFVKAYRERANKDPSSEVSYHYFATYAFVEAMNQACSTTDPNKIRAELDAAIKAVPAELNAPGITGVTEAGAFIIDAPLATVEDGEIVPTTREALLTK